jgi:hypothetical protein
MFISHAERRILCFPLVKYSIRVSNQHGELSVEADSLNELQIGIVDVGMSSQLIEQILASGHSPLTESNRTLIVTESRNTSSQGIFEFDSKGHPHATVSLTPLNAREIIGLLLYSKDPTPLTLGEFDKIVATNWKSVGVEYLSAVTSQLKQYMIKEGEKGNFTYRLSGAGKDWVRNVILPKLNANPPGGNK